MKKIFNTIKWPLAKTGKWFLRIVFSIALIFFIFINIYDFQKPIFFSGNNLYNPYESLGANSWKLGNFHTHSKCWKGLTSGDGEEEEVIDRYKFLNYDILAISNYHKTSQANTSSLLNIVGYEHGFGASKTHQLVLGDSKINWFELPFFHTLNSKQHILSKLKKSYNLVAIPHPHIRSAYTEDNMKKLAFFDCIEAVGQYGDARYLWDASLSAGHPAMIICNDDLHRKDNLAEIGNFATLVKSGNTQEEILTALKKGSSIGVNINNTVPKTWLEKKNQIARLEHLEFLKTENNIIDLELSHKAQWIKFIGQNGIVKKMVKNTKKATYIIKTSDSYIRTEIHFANSGNTFYLNPVFRYHQDPFENQHIATINKTKTVLHRVFVLVILSLINIAWIKALILEFKEKINQLKTKKEKPTIAFD